MQRMVLACSFLLAACAGDIAPSPDAPAGGGAFGATCTVVSDTASTECTSHVCTGSFDQIGHPVCSQLCTFMMNDSCPVGASGAKMCNMKGYCKP